MQIKQFSGDSVDEILKEIRQELGDDAVILQTKRVVRGGIGGFFGKQGVEVTAAEGLSEGQAEAATSNLDAARSAAAPEPGDEVFLAAPETPPPAFARHLSGQLAAAVEAEAPLQEVGGGPAASPSAAYARAGALAPRPFAPGDAQRTQAIIEAAREALRQAHTHEAAEAMMETSVAAPQAATVAPPAFLPATPADAPVPETPAAAVEAPTAFVPAMPLTDLPPEALGATVATPPPAEKTPASPPAPSAPPAPVEPATRPEGDGIGGDSVRLDAPFEVSGPGPDALPQALQRTRAELLSFGVAERYLDPLLEGFLGSGLPFVDVAEDEFRDAFRRWLTDRLPVVRDWRPKAMGTTVALVGQRGTGKTAIAAKLAGRCAAAGMSVGLIGAGASGHQTLAEHARALGLSAAVAPDVATVEEARASFADRDLIVIDTPGCSAQDLREIEALAALTKAGEPDEVHLVLPVSYPLADLGDVARRFRLVGVNRLALTKLDETRFAGNLLNFPFRLGKPLSYVADGPEVPTALHAADARDVAELLLP